MADTEAKVKRLIIVAKLHEEIEQYEEMAKAMKEVAELLHESELPADKKSLSSEHRNHLSVAYKNVVGTKRSAWRLIANMEKKEEEGTLKREIAQGCKEKIADQLKKKCDEVIDVIDKYLIPNAKEKEEEVFYIKMKGDYYRYLSEVTTGDLKKDAIKMSANAYEKANDIAVDLAPTHPIRLGLALNYSVFYYEIMNEPDKACNLAKKAFDDAIKELDQLKEEVYKDSTLIMQLLRDNLTLWTADPTGGDDDD